MSLGKLLTTGKSLVGLNSSASRYQLRKGALPKFKSSKNPFAPRAQDETGAPSAEQAPELPKLTPAEMAAAKLKKTQRLPLLNAKGEVIEQESIPVEPVQPAPAAAIPAIGGWLKRLNSLVWRANRKSADLSAVNPRLSKRPVQGELSLDNIKVMRNDLSESDVEVAPVKSRPVPVLQAPAEASAAAMAIPELPPARNAWEFLGERLLGKH